METVKNVASGIASTALGAVGLGGRGGQGSHIAEGLADVSLPLPRSLTPVHREVTGGGHGIAAPARGTASSLAPHASNAPADSVSSADRSVTGKDAMEFVQPTEHRGETESTAPVGRASAVATSTAPVIGEGVANNNERTMVADVPKVCIDGQFAEDGERRGGAMGKADPSDDVATSASAPARNKHQQNHLAEVRSVDSNGETGGDGTVSGNNGRGIDVDGPQAEGLENNRASDGGSGNGVGIVAGLLSTIGLGSGNKSGSVEGRGAEGEGENASTDQMTASSGPAARVSSEQDHTNSSRAEETPAPAVETPVSAANATRGERGSDGVDDGAKNENEQRASPPSGGGIVASAISGAKAMLGFGSSPADDVEDESVPKDREVHPASSNEGGNQEANSRLTPEMKAFLEDDSDQEDAGVDPSTSKSTSADLSPVVPAAANAIPEPPRSPSDTEFSATHAKRVIGSGVVLERKASISQVTPEMRNKSTFSAEDAAATISPGAIGERVKRLREEQEALKAKHATDKQDTDLSALSADMTRKGSVKGKSHMYHQALNEGGERDSRPKTITRRLSGDWTQRRESLDQYVVEYKPPPGVSGTPTGEGSGSGMPTHFVPPPRPTAASAANSRRSVSSGSVNAGITEKDGSDSKAGGIAMPDQGDAQPEAADINGTISGVDKGVEGTRDERDGNGDGGSVSVDGDGKPLEADTVAVGTASALPASEEGMDDSAAIAAKDNSSLGMNAPSGPTAVDTDVGASSARKDGESTAFSTGLASADGKTGSVAPGGNAMADGQTQGATSKSSGGGCCVVS